MLVILVRLNDHSQDSLQIGVINASPAEPTLHRSTDVTESIELGSPSGLRTHNFPVGPFPVANALPDPVNLLAAESVSLCGGIHDMVRKDGTLGGGGRVLRELNHGDVRRFPAARPAGCDRPLP